MVSLWDPRTHFSQYISFSFWKAVSNCRQDFCSNIYRRYVDNIFVTFNSHEQLKKFVECMHTKHTHTKLTFEYEHNNSFLSLDVKICREIIYWLLLCIKNLHLLRVFTNSKSFIPADCKFSLVYTQLHRCFDIAFC